MKISKSKILDKGDWGFGINIDQFIGDNNVRYRWFLLKFAKWRIKIDF